MTLAEPNKRDSLLAVVESRRPPGTAEEIAAILGWKLDATEELLAGMARAGLVQLMPIPPHARPRRAWITTYSGRQRLRSLRSRSRP